MSKKNKAAVENLNSKKQDKSVRNKIAKPCILLIFAILFLGAGVFFAQQSKSTEEKADGKLKSSARVNPVTLAMEFSLPIGSYPGRAGNAIPIKLSYSSKVWESKLSAKWDDRYAVTEPVSNTRF